MKRTEPYYTKRTPKIVHYPLRAGYLALLERIFGRPNWRIEKPYEK